MRLAEFDVRNRGTARSVEDLIIHLVHTANPEIPQSFRKPSEWNALNAEGFGDLRPMRLGSSGVDRSGKAQIWYDAAAEIDEGFNLWFFLTDHATDAAGLNVVAYLSPEVRRRAAPVERFRVTLGQTSNQNPQAPTSIARSFAKGAGASLSRFAHRLPETLPDVAPPAEAAEVLHRFRDLRGQVPTTSVGGITVPVAVVPAARAGSQDDAAPPREPPAITPTTVASAGILRTSRAGDRPMAVMVSESGTARLSLPRVPNRLRRMNRGEAG